MREGAAVDVRADRAEERVQVGGGAHADVGAESAECEGRAGGEDRAEEGERRPDAIQMPERAEALAWNNHTAIVVIRVHHIDAQIVQRGTCCEARKEAGAAACRVERQRNALHRGMGAQRLHKRETELYARILCAQLEMRETGQGGNDV